MCYWCCTVAIFHFQDILTLAVLKKSRIGEDLKMSLLSLKYGHVRKGLNAILNKFHKFKWVICIKNNLPIQTLSFSKLCPTSNPLGCICAGIRCACVRIPTCLDRGWTGFKNLSKQGVISQDSYSDWAHETSWYFCMKSIQIFTPYTKPSSQRLKDLPQFQLNRLNSLLV